jgi:hypothetical protein
MLLLVVIGIRGPDFFWLMFWTHDLFRSLLFAGLAAVGTAVLVASWTDGLRQSGRASMATGSVCVATGFALMVLTLVLPDIQGTLAALDDPLQLLPMRPAIINGVTQYAGVSDSTLRLPGVIGVALMAAGGVLRGIGTTLRPRDAR